MSAVSIVICVVLLVLFVKYAIAVLAYAFSEKATIDTRLERFSK